MKTAILIPCLNEESQISWVIEQCREHIPLADIYVLDNNSTDRTVDVALAAGAHVIHSPRRGKGHVMRHAFSIIKADLYAMLDGDGTYPPKELKRLIEEAKNNPYDMITGSRMNLADPKAFRRFHLFGNHAFSIFARFAFAHPITDLMSGCRVFSRRFVESLEIQSGEFELETELTLRCVADGFWLHEMPIHYGRRNGTSQSKLRSFRDGWKILGTMIRLWRGHYPFRYFGTLAALSLAAWKLAPNPSAKELMALFTVSFVAVGLHLETLVAREKTLRKELSQKDQPKPLPFKKCRLDEKRGPPYP